MVRKTGERQNTILCEGPGLVILKTRILINIEDSKMLKAFNLRNSMAKLVFKSTIWG